MNSNTLIKAKEIEKIAAAGEKIYARLKHKYEPRHHGKFLAIDVESGDVYLANDGAKAAELARQEHPNKIFYLVKIGFETAESVARSFSKSI